MKIITLSLLLLFGAAAHADGLTIGAGKLANNANTAHPGWLMDATYTHGPLQFSATRVGNTLMGDELNASAIYKRSWGRFSAGAGIILAQSYQIPQWWFESGNQQNWGVHAQCLLCGVAVQVGWQLSPRLEFQVRYWGTERFLIPSHNGALGVLSFHL